MRSKVYLRRGGSWQQWYKIMQRRSGAWVQISKIMQRRGGAWVSLIDLTPDEKQYSDSWTSNWEASYQSDGSRRTDVSGIGYQGYYSGTNGRQSAMFGFNDEDIRATLSGSRIDRVDITASVEHTYYNAGSIFQFGTHNVDEQPGSYSRVSRALATSPTWATGSRSLTDVSKTFGNQLRDNDAKGLVLDVTSNSLDYYGAIDSVTIKIWYTK